MKNLDQIRAARALTVASRTTKAAASRIPAMIINNGLLAAAAFGCEMSDPTKAKRPEMREVFDGTAQHLGNPLIGIAALAGCTDAKTLVQRLAAADSAVLQQATAEALAFIGYVKRFATKEKSDK